MFTRSRLALPLLAAVLCSSFTCANAAAPLPTVQRFFDSPRFSGAVLSPDAMFLAVRNRSAGGRDTLAVVDLSTMAVKIVANFNDADIGTFSWVNAKRLVFTSADRQAAQGDIDFAPGLYAVDRDGSGFRQLAERRGHFVRSGNTRELQPWNTYMMRQSGAQDSDSVYVLRPNFGRSELVDVDLVLLNTVSGRTTAVPRPPRTRGFLLDQRGEPRVAVADEEGKRLVWYRDPQTTEWRQLAQFPLYGGSAGFNPVGFGPDGILYVQSRLDTDKSALYRFDFAANAIDPTPVLRVADYDFGGQLISNGQRLLGVRLTTDADTTEWFDAPHKALQARIDAKLPATVNQIYEAPRAATPWVLVQSYSDVQPRTTLLFNTETGVFNKIGSAYEGIDPAQMGRQQLVHYKARDGRSIPAWLTVPPGAAAKNLPMVVLAHDGPFRRAASWGWKADSQFLASRGYAVLEPEYRGSLGYGFAHFQAGWQQWGQAMQDDLADAARWAAAEGVADAARICIAGHGAYGGYAALMGLVNDATLFRCGVELSGITDINLLVSGTWLIKSDLSDSYKQYGLPMLVGDVEAAPARFQAVSPLAQAGRITKPLLMAYGAVDRRVPLHHGSKLHAALKRGNPDVEFVAYDDDSGNLASPQNRFDFWTRVERFLDKQIGSGSGSAK